MIELNNVTKDFGAGSSQVHALHGISLTIRDGEIFGIIGLSGAGKSTLVRCINLLERPTSGSVIVDGKELTALSDRELRLGKRLFQSRSPRLKPFLRRRREILLRELKGLRAASRPDPLREETLLSDLAFYDAELKKITSQETEADP